MGFVFPGGFYKWLYMPFSLKNATSCFQHYMDKILRGIPKSKAECYIDNLLLKSEMFEQHIQNMCEVFDHLQKNNMMVNTGKCDFLRESVVYLGYTVSERGLLPGQRNVHAVCDFPTPKTLKQVQSFHGLCSYFRRFVPNFAKISHPLTKLFQPDMPWTWGPEQEKAFEALKEALTSAQMLAYPDPTKPFFLHTDASLDSLGVCLMQHDAKNPKYFHPVGYVSWALMDRETQYTIT